jgi:hypothetical protein
MDFLSRSKNKLYKTYENCSVEYHAGGFFIRKAAIYIFFQTNDSLIFLERNEGLHPFDNEYSKLFAKELINGKTFRLIDSRNNVATYSADLGEIKIMPSVFEEHFNNKKVTELLVDFGKGKIQIFFLAFDISEIHS